MAEPIPEGVGGRPPRAGAYGVTACVHCNTRKAASRIDEIGWTLEEPAENGWNGLTDFYPTICELAHHLAERASR